MNEGSTKTRIDFQKARFHISASKLGQCPAESRAEIAFVGRSNAGKSSAINTLTDQTKLARTSKTPGRTQLLNFFSLENQYFLVDLPGFGFAQVPDKIKQNWQRELDNYLAKREPLAGLVLLTDCRHPFKEFDQLIIQWCSEAGLPLLVLLTKSDKLKAGAKKKALMDASKLLDKSEGDITVQLFSSLKGEGVGQLKGWLNRHLDDFAANSEEIAEVND